MRREPKITSTLMTATTLLLLAILAFILNPSEAEAAATLTWTDTSNNEDSFRVLKMQPDKVNFKEIGKVGPNVTTFVDQAGVSGDCYRVTAINSAGESEPSNTACVILLPAAPTGLVVTILLVNP